MLTRRSKIKSWLKFITLHLELNSVEMLENCIVVKPRQPRFMIVQWNHRVEEKLLFRGVCLFTYRASKTYSLACSSAHGRHFSTRGVWRSVLLLSPHQATRCYRQILVKSVGSRLSSLDPFACVWTIKSGRSKFWYGSIFRGFNFRSAVGDRKLNPVENNRLYGITYIV